MNIHHPHSDKIPFLTSPHLLTLLVMLDAHQELALVLTKMQDESITLS